MPDVPLLSRDPPTVRQSIDLYLQEKKEELAPDKVQVLGAALQALLGPALDEPVGELTNLRLVLLGGELKGKVSPRTGRTLAASTFRRYVLAGQAFAAWAVTRWPPVVPPASAAGQVPPGAAAPAAPGQHLGALVRVLRTDAGMSRADLATAARIAEPVLKLVELGKRTLTRNQLDRLVEVPSMARLLAWAEREGVDQP